MKVQLKQLTATLALTTSLLVSVPAMADDAQPVPAAASTALASYTLNDNLKVEILGVHSVQNSSGVELGAAVRVINTSNDTVRIPDHELRIKAEDGVVYTLPASSSNAHGVPGQSDVELTYLKQINRQKQLNVTDLSLLDVNYDVYPKQERTLLSVPVGNMTWQGVHTVFTDPSMLKKWGEAFTIPTLKSPLTYTPVSVTKSFNNNGTSYLINLLVENPGDQNETVPSFILEGKTKSNAYDGSAVESGVVLQPSEKKYIHYVINADLDTVLDSVNVVTGEPFTQSDSASQTKVSAVTIGRLNFTLPSSVSSTAAESYSFGTAVAFDPFNDFVNPNLQISLVELHATTSEDNGYKTTFAKFNLENKSDKPIPVPTLQTELVNGSGITYSGVRQASTLQSVQPGTSTIVSYAFVLPTTEASDSFTLKLQGTVQSNSTAPAYRSTIAALPVAVQPDDDHTAVHLYPYTLNIKSWTLSPIMQSISTYSYKLHLDMDFTRDPQVVLDNNFSTLKFELIDALGSSLGAKYFPFVGANRLVSGYQGLVFTGVTSDQANSNLTVKISESINTPSGEMNRVIAILKP
jgi:hypothetical protein